jgi:hypothetical protein
MKNNIASESHMNNNLKTICITYSETWKRIGNRAFRFPDLGLYAFHQGYLIHKDDEEDRKEEEEKDEGIFVEDPYIGKEWNSTGAPL